MAQFPSASASHESGAGGSALLGDQTRRSRADREDGNRTTQESGVEVNIITGEKHRRDEGDVPVGSPEAKRRRDVHNGSRYRARVESVEAEDEDATSAEIKPEVIYIKSSPIQGRRRTPRPYHGTSGERTAAGSRSDD